MPIINLFYQSIGFLHKLLFELHFLYSLVIVLPSKHFCNLNSSVCYLLKSIYFKLKCFIFRKLITNISYETSFCVFADDISNNQNVSNILVFYQDQMLYFFSVLKYISVNISYVEKEKGLTKLATAGLDSYNMLRCNNK